MTKREYEAPIDEVVDRVRRMETKLTKLLDYVGLDTDSMRAVYRDGKVLLPSINISVREVLAALPLDARGSVLMVDGKSIGFFSPSTILE
jgi:hypothetical protein